MIKQILHADWTLRPVGDLSEVPAELRDIVIPANVPGCVHMDLLRAGKIPDPYLDFNEYKLGWIGRTDWEYRTTFDADSKMFDHERIDLVCDGLDTIARIELNGTLVAETFNMHRGYRFDVRKLLLRRGRNELRITFASPLKYAEAMQEKIGPLPRVNGPAGPFNFINKMACNFGWDWGPALVTSGIWRGIRLEGWSKTRIADVQLSVVFADHEHASLAFGVNLEKESWEVSDLKLTCRDPDGKDVGVIRRKLEFDDFRVSGNLEIDWPKLWWPKGHGEQSLYQLELVFEGEQWSSRFGLRTVELDISPDDIGRKFVIKVNGKPIFCKGFNWIPDDCFLDRACEPTRVRRRIQQAVDAGANMLRVWGGGIYETDDFYNICDELGVLVWQDFPFACAMYPEEEPFRSEVEAEARDNVARLAHHPSLAIWNGCNENIWGYRDWGWKDKVKGRTWGKGFYFDLLPRICKELTPTIPYWAGSPWSGDYDVDNGVHPNAATHGNKHVWEAWFKDDYSAYREFAPRFCSEFGFQAPATFASIASVVPEQDRDFGSVLMRHHQKSGNAFSDEDDGDRRNLRHLIRHFNLPGAQELLENLRPRDQKPDAMQWAPLHPAQALPSKVNFDDLHYLLQVNQARALTLGVEWFRSRQSTCMGALYWQLNDCWPGATSWSCVDGSGRKKPLWYATRKFFNGSLETIQPGENGALELFAINDTDEPGYGKTWITRRDFAGNILAEQEISIEYPPRSVRRHKIDPSVATPGDASCEFIAVGVPTHTTWFFLPDRELKYPAASFEAIMDKGRLTIHARSLLRDVCVFADRIDPAAEVSDQLITLLPDESFTFAIESNTTLDKERLTSPPVLRCVNPFGKQI